MDIILNAKVVYYFFLCMCICGCGDQRSTLSVIPQEIYSVSLIGLELTNCARLAGQWALGSVCLHLPRACITRMHHTQLYMGSGN